MTEPPDYVTAIPNSQSIHVMPTLPGEVGGLGITQEQLIQFGKDLIEGIVRAVVLKVVGVLLPGPAGEQLTSWANGILDQFLNIGNLFGGADLTDGSLDVTDVWTTVISAFINPLSGIIGALESALGGGSDPGGDVSGIFSGFTNFLSMFNNPTGLLTSPGSFDPTASGMSITDDFVPGVGTTTDNIVQKLLGLVGSGFSHADSAEALGNTADSTTSSAGQIAQLWAAIQSGGATALDDFERSGASLGGNWHQTYSGSGGFSLGTGGHATAWSVSLGDRGSLNRWQGTTTDTTDDYQKITVVLGGAPAHNFLGDDGSNGVIGRMKNDDSEWVGWFVNGSKAWKLSYFSSGSETVLTSGTLSAVPGSGASIEMTLGDSATTTKRKYRVKINNADLFSGGWYTEVGTGSPLGASNRGYGFFEALEHAAGFFFPPAFSGPTNQWAVQDA